MAPPPWKAGRCKYYAEDGTPLRHGEGCFRDRLECAFIHPDDLEWDYKGLHNRSLKRSRKDRDHSSKTRTHRDRSQSRSPSHSHSRSPHSRRKSKSSRRRHDHRDSDARPNNQDVSPSTSRRRYPEESRDNPAPRSEGDSLPSVPRAERRREDRYPTDPRVERREEPKHPPLPPPLPSPPQPAFLQSLSLKVHKQPAPLSREEKMTIWRERMRLLTVAVKAQMDAFTIEEDLENNREFQESVPIPHPFLKPMKVAILKVQIGNLQKTLSAAEIEANSKIEEFVDAYSITDDQERWEERMDQVEDEIIKLIHQLDEAARELSKTLVALQTVPPPPKVDASVLTSVDREDVDKPMESQDQPTETSQPAKKSIFPLPSIEDLEEAEDELAGIEDALINLENTIVEHSEERLLMVDTILDDKLDEHQGIKNSINEGDDKLAEAERNIEDIGTQIEIMAGEVESVILRAQHLEEGSVEIRAKTEKSWKTIQEELQNRLDALSLDVGASDRQLATLSAAVNAHASQSVNPPPPPAVSLPQFMQALERPISQTIQEVLQPARSTVLHEHEEASRLYDHVLVNSTWQALDPTMQILDSILDVNVAPTTEDMHSMAH